MTKSAPTFDEVDYPYPPRFRWLKRIAILYVLLAVALAGVRVWWGRHAQKKLDDSVAAIRAAGEPALIEDLNGDPIPNADNAAYYYRLAIAKLNPNAMSPAASNYTYTEYPPFSKKWFAMTEASRSANQPAFDLVREARKHPRVQWSNQYASPLMNVVLSHLNGLRNLANHIGDNALLLHFEGNDAEAIESIKDLWVLSRAAEKQSFLITHLVGVGIRALTLNRLEIIATELTIEGRSPTTRPTDHPATRKQVDELIAMLLDEDADGAAAVHAYAGERLFQADGILYYPKAGKLLRPMFQLDAVSAMHHMDKLIASATQPTLQSSLSALSGMPNLVPQNLAHVMSRVMVPSLNRARATDFKVIAEARMAATILAVRLYRLDHNGEFPPTLDALVPKYLAQVPDDPMTPGPSKIGYVPPGKAPHPLVYSVGEDYQDNTATATTWPTEPQQGWNPKTLDQMRDLTRWSPPRTPKATTTTTTPANPGDEDSDQTLDD
jgi:hypothetical protein